MPSTNGGETVRTGRLEVRSELKRIRVAEIRARGQRSGRWHDGRLHWRTQKRRHGAGVRGRKRHESQDNARGPGRESGKHASTHQEGSGMELSVARAST
jgi:hypothetical protein